MEDVLRRAEDEWLWGWDPTPGIVSVWAGRDGHAIVWRRMASTGALVRERERFRPWLLLDRLDGLRHLNGNLITCRELDGPGELRYLLSADDWQTLTSARGRELGKETFLALPPEEQYLVATGRTYFRDLAFDQLRRMQFDLETTGLSPECSRIFMIAVRFPSGVTEILEARDDSDAAEAELIGALCSRLKAADPDVIENHNLHGFDLPFLDRRAALLGIPLSLGRLDAPRLQQRAARTEP